jgi:hypothetical protein
MGAVTCSGWPIEWSKTVAVGDAEMMAEAREMCDRGLLVACASCSAERAVGFHARRGVAAEAIEEFRFQRALANVGSAGGDDFLLRG